MRRERDEREREREWRTNENTRRLIDRGQRVRQLRRHVDPAVAARRHRPLPVQRLWALLQDERPEPAAHQAQAKTGKCKSNFFASFSVVLLGTWTV